VIHDVWIIVDQSPGHRLINRVFGNEANAQKYMQKAQQLDSKLGTSFSVDWTMLHVGVENWAESQFAQHVEEVLGLGE
jgi:hypothetical protein